MGLILYRSCPDGDPLHTLMGHYEGEYLMKYLYLLLFFCFPDPVYALQPERDLPISKFEFQGVHFGDFPSVDMICVRGLCPVGEVGVGISNNSVVPPAYNQQRAITHYHGAKISTPEFSYFDDKMYMVKFTIECKLQGVDECVAAVEAGLDAEYGLHPTVPTRSDLNPSVTKFMTEAGSLVSIIRTRKVKGQIYPIVRIVDRALMGRLLRSFNPDYVPPKIEILKTEESVAQ